MIYNRLFVIPLAGEGSRFPIEKWKVPKPLIKYNGISFLEYSLRSMPVQASDKVIFVIRDGFHRLQIEKAINSLCNRLDYTVVVVHQATKGQADSVRLALANQDVSLPLWIHNGDTALNCDWESVDSRLDGTLITFRDSSPRWSFVEIDTLGKVLQVAEKQPISDLASTGTYIFRRASDFLESLKVNEKHLVNGEQYVAPLYNYLISKGLHYSILESPDVFCLGTPEDFDLAKERLNTRWVPSW
jgi:NDP-sugar pyrophosphorylase family protein